MLPYYYSLNEYLKKEYGHKIYKLALNGGMSCPNRDGLIDTRGCIFCSAGGSGDFAGGRAGYALSQSVDEQIIKAKELIAAKYRPVLIKISITLLIFSPLPIHMLMCPIFVIFICQLYQEMILIFFQ